MAEKNGLQELGDAMVKTLVQELGRYGLKNSNLANSIKYKINKNILSIEMYEYGLAIDEGTEPHIPPFDEINEWAKSKGLNTWAVMYSMGEDGTKARPFLKSIDRELNKYSQILGDAMFKFVSDDIDSIIMSNFSNAIIK